MCASTICHVVNFCYRNRINLQNFHPTVITVSLHLSLLFSNHHSTPLHYYSIRYFVFIINYSFLIYIYLVLLVSFHSPLPYSNLLLLQLTIHYTILITTPLLVKSYAHIKSKKLKIKIVPYSTARSIYSNICTRNARIIDANQFQGYRRIGGPVVGHGRGFLIVIDH